jgi:hypothetical protein
MAKTIPPTFLDDRRFILAAISDDRAGLLEGIKFLYNCRDADVDPIGAIWIADPQRGHWLDKHDLARINDALRDGVI